MNDKIAVIIYCYKRVKSLKNLLNDIDFSLSNNPNNRLKFYFFIDGRKEKDSDVNKNLIKIEINRFSKKYPSSVKERTTNLGLSENIKSAIDYVIEFHNKFISLEDDLRLSVNYFEYMINLLDFYLDDLSIGSISGANYFNRSFSRDIIISSYADCLGWGSWKDRWINQNRDLNSLLKLIKNHKYEFNRDNTYPYYRLLRRQRSINTSWAIIWYANNFLKKRFMIFSSICLVSHRVYSTGTNYSNNLTTDPLNNDIDNESLIRKPQPKDKLINGDKLLNEFYMTYNFGKVRRLLLKYGFYN
tara:strand:- start:15864 stop:16766 length:903 start_codon:yes stop_codon:yes gene_type:complete